MKKTQANLLSCRIREMNSDLLPVERRLRNHPECYVHTYVKSLDDIAAKSDDSFLLPPSGEFEKNVFLCNDLALRHLLAPFEVSHPQMLLITQNNFYYQLAQKTFFNRQERQTLAKFSHIFVPNSFVLKTITRSYRFTKHQKVALMETPFSFRLRSAQRQQDKRLDFTLRYPQTAGKKILFLMLPKKIAPEKRSLLESFSLADFMDKLGGDWFLVSNFLPLFKQTDKDCQDCALYLNQSYPLTDLLYFSDLLISDLSFFAHGQMSRNKPFFCLSHENNAFELYMKKNYPALFLPGLDDLFDTWITKEDKFKEAFQKFHQEITYEQQTDPAEQLTELILN